MPGCIFSLLAPLRLRDIAIPNRMWLSPMCQNRVSTADGVPDDWHLVHLGGRAAGGFGLVMAEATAITPDGRITPYDTGLWMDRQIQPWRRIADFIRGAGAVPGIQLAHAGRKGSMWPPGRPGSVSTGEGGWQTQGPSAVAFGDLRPPRELTTGEVAEIPARFAEAARRAHAAGFDVVELHAAHGYMLHQFLSPLSNHRTDEYGGTFANRARLLVETAAAVRLAWPGTKPLFLRISATDWAPGGWDLDEAAELAPHLARAGVDLIDVSSGGLVADAEIQTAPGYQVPLADRVRSTGVATAAVGLIIDAHQAEAILESGAADAVMIGRSALVDPFWALHAQAELGVDPADIPYPEPYHGDVLQLLRTTQRVATP